MSYQSREYRIDVVRDFDVNSVAIFIICVQTERNYRKQFVLNGRQWNELVIGKSEPTIFLYGNDVIGKDLFANMIREFEKAALINFVLENNESHNGNEGKLEWEDEREIKIGRKVHIEETWQHKSTGRKLLMDDKITED